MPPSPPLFTLCYCRHHGRSQSSQPSGPTAKLVTVHVDGRLGPETVKALQTMLKYFGVPHVGPTDGQ